ncbi:unnamed protein product [Brachionus calyciflorus]|uniref:F-box domain-containing protein n=1 Tax=Brachionus calyciflorus TaxID=104777 RepID=A0A813MXE5_9BILA|nr:unnamed protein product [Brachionus calyciflorus]
MELVKNTTGSKPSKGLFEKVKSVFQSSKKSNVNQKISSNVITVHLESSILKQESESKKIFDDELKANLDIIDKISRYLNDTQEHFNKELVKEEEAMNISEIDALPNEIICKIFDYLDFCDRKNASLVSKKWRHAFLESYYLKNIMIKANNQLFLSNRPSSSPNNSLKHGHRSSSSMALSIYSSSSNFNYQLYNNLVNLEFDSDAADVSLLVKNLQQGKNNEEIKRLPKLQTLKFFKTTMSAKTLIDLLNEAPNLNNLSIIECDSLFMTGFLTFSLSQDKIDALNNLVELNLSKNRYMTDFLLNLFLNSTNSLQRLDLSYCNFTKTNFKSIENTKFQVPTLGNCVLTFENLIKQSKRLTNLESINLSGIDNLIHNQESFFELIEKLPNLKEIQLENLPNLKVDTVVKLLALTPRLKCINLNNSIQNDDLKQNGIEIFLEKSRNLHEDLNSHLEIIKLKRAKINDPRLLSSQFTSLIHLTYLDLSCMMFQRSFGTVNRLNEFVEEFAFNLSRCHNLEHLNLSYCDFLVNDSFIKIISKNFKNLKHLDIRNCSQITDTSLHFISTFMTKLVYLDLSWCQNISDSGLDASIKHGDENRLLNEFNKHINGSCRCIRKYTEQPFLLLKTKNELNSESRKQFCGCVESGNDASLDSSSRVEIAQDFEINPNVSLKNLSSLKVLKLEACVNVSDLGLFNGVNWKKLNELDIKLCTNISGDYVKDEMSKKYFSNFKTLNLNQCLKFKEENLLFLVENSPNLRELSVGGLSCVTNNLIETLLRMRKLLVLLDISFCTDVNESCVEKYEQFLLNEYGLRDFFIDKRFISK